MPPFQADNLPLLGRNKECQRRYRLYRSLAGYPAGNLWLDRNTAHHCRRRPRRSLLEYPVGSLESDHIEGCPCTNPLSHNSKVYLIGSQERDHNAGYLCKYFQYRSLGEYPAGSPAQDRRLARPRRRCRWHCRSLRAYRRYRCRFGTIRLLPECRHSCTSSVEDRVRMYCLCSSYMQGSPLRSRWQPGRRRNANPL